LINLEKQIGVTMRTLILSLLVLLVSGTFTLAAPPKWYLAGNLNAGALFEQPKNDYESCVQDNSEVFPLAGMELDGGLKLKRFDFRLGFRHANAWKARKYSSGKEIYHLHSNRLVLGLRYIVPLEHLKPVSLVAGGAVTFGWMKRYFRYDNHSDQLAFNRSGSQKSKGVPGWLGEFGFHFQLKPKWSLLALVQLEYYKMSLPAKGWMDSTESYFSPTLQIGTQYALGSSR
jgi:hypothetical protein